jgi:hypothetical protein
MLTPIVKETSALSAHRREVELVRWSLMAVPGQDARRDAIEQRDPLRGLAPARLPRRGAEPVRV